MTLPTGNNRGLTLIELLLSIAILASALAVILQGLVRSTYAMSVARNRLHAYAFITSKLAEVELAARQEKALRPEGSFRLNHDLFSWHLDDSLLSPTIKLTSLRVEWQQADHPYSLAAAVTLPQPESPTP